MLVLLAEAVHPVLLLLQEESPEVVVCRLLAETVEPVLECAYPGHVLEECCSVAVKGIILVLNILISTLKV